MKILIAITLVAAFAAFGPASAACTPSSPDAVTSKAPKDAASDPKAADAKGIAEDGQHVPMETDPNAPGVTKSEGGTTTNITQAELEIAAASTKENCTDASGTTDPQGTACPQ